MKKKIRKLLALAAILASGLCICLLGAVSVSAADETDTSAYVKRASLKSSYQKIYDKVIANIDALAGDYEAGAVVIDCSGEDISYNESAGDTIYIPVGSVLIDYPEYEWLSSGTLIAESDGAGKLTAIRLRDGYTNARISAYQDINAFTSEMSQMEAVIAELVSAAEAFSSDYEKLLYFHDWLVSNNVYNTYVSSGQDDLADRRSWSAVSAFLSANDPASGPVCEGYAEAFKILCNRLNISCMCLEGRDHKWNLVYLDGSWYAVDCTWDDSGIGASISYDYFLAGNDTMTRQGTTYGQNHGYSTSPVPETSEKGYAWITGVSVSDADFDGLPHGIIGEAAASNGGNALTGEFATSYYQIAGDGTQTDIGTEAPLQAGSYAAVVTFANDSYAGTLRLTYEIRGEAQEEEPNPTETPEPTATPEPTKEPEKSGASGQDEETNNTQDGSNGQESGGDEKTGGQISSDTSQIVAAAQTKTSTKTKTSKTAETTAVKVAAVKTGDKSARLSYVFLMICAASAAVFAALRERKSLS